MSENFVNPFIRSGRNSVIDRRAYPGGQQQTIDDAAMQDTSNPLLQMDAATPPTRAIPFQEFPRIVYKHPKQAYRRVEHRNANHELVHVEMIPSEHMAKSCKDQAEVDLALKQGWKLNPFIAEPLPDPNPDLYEDDYPVETVQHEPEDMGAAAAGKLRQRKNQSQE